MVNKEYRKFSDLVHNDQATQKQRANYIYATDEKLIFEKIIFDKELTIDFRNYHYDGQGINTANNFSIIFNGNTWYFIDCKFESRLKFERQISNNYIFEDCSFQQIDFEDIKLDKNIVNFKDIGRFEIKNNNKKVKNIIEKISISHCEFGNIFKITSDQNKKQIKSFDIKESVFENEFQIYNLFIDEIKVEETEFHNMTFYDITFSKKSKKEVVFDSSNIKGIGIFELCEFHSKVLFAYVTFYELAQFRDSTFKKGLDLDKTNIKNEMNFYGVKDLDKIESKRETSQETYRIIKHNFEKINNRIEANKYHALELEKRKVNLLRKKGHWQEKLIFLGNWCTSKFATNWGLALVWIVVVGFVTALIIHSSVIFQVYKTPSLLMSWDYLERGLGTVAKYISIIHSDEEIKEHPILFLFNKVALGYLYYQFVTAVRKDTRK